MHPVIRSFRNRFLVKSHKIQYNITSVSKYAFSGIAKNAKIYIKASEKDFERIVELIELSMIADSVPFIRLEVEE